MAIGPAQFCLPFLLCDISDPGSRAFILGEDRQQREGFVIRRGQRAYAYHNQCPHTGVSLNWSEHVFLDSSEEFIQCAMHGALFSIEDGRCIRGPCVGDCLQKIEMKITPTGHLFIELERKKPL